MGLISQTRRGFVNHALQPWSRVAVAVDVQVGVADHVSQQECLHLFQGSVRLPFLRQMSNPIQTVGHEIDFGIRLHSFFRVVPN